MFNLKIKLATAAIAVASTASLASPAIAGQCTTPGIPRPALRGPA